MLSEKNSYLDATIRTAQYLSGLTVHHEIWHEINKTLITFLDVDFVSYAQTTQQKGVKLNKFSFKDKILEAKLSPSFDLAETSNRANIHDDMKKNAQIVLDSCFFSWDQLDYPVPCTILFLPITVENKVDTVLITGYSNEKEISKELLNIFLAISGIIGTTVTRIYSEMELRNHRTHLEELVHERTDMLTKANEQLKKEIIERKEAEKRITALLDEKKILMKESQQKIKTHLNMIYELLFLQAETTENKENRLILMDAANRLNSMTMLYNKLYKYEENCGCSVKDYLSFLIKKIIEIYSKTVKINCIADIKDFPVEEKTLSYLGIIVNELITHTIKNTLNKEEIVIGLSVHKSKKLAIIKFETDNSVIQDQTGNHPAGSEIRLIPLLVQQINGSWEIIEAERTTYILRAEV